MNGSFQVYVLCDCRKPGPWTYGDYTFDYKPFYVGQTRHLKARVLQHMFKNNALSERMRLSLEHTHDVRVETIAGASTHSDICALESQAIAAIGRKDLGRGPLLNRASGKQGADFYALSQSQRARYRRLNRQERVAGMDAIMEGNRKFWASMSDEARSKRGQHIARMREWNNTELPRREAIGVAHRKRNALKYKELLSAFSHFRACLSEIETSPKARSRHKCNIHGVFEDHRHSVAKRVKEGADPCKFCVAESFDYAHANKVEALYRRQQHA